MAEIKDSKMLKWIPSATDFSHFKNFERVYGSVSPSFPSTLGRQRRAILDQGASDECTDFQGAARAGYRSGKDFSRKWHGAKESELLKQLIVNGADPRTALKVPLAFGSLPLASEPALAQAATPSYYLDWGNWPVPLDKLAAPYLEVAYHLIDGPYDHFDNIRTALLQAQQENQVALVFSEWFPEWNASHGIAGVPKSRPVASHASLFIDWMQADNEPALINHLSQGTSFGDQGFLYFPRETVNQQVENGNMGVYIFREHPDQPAIMNAIAELDSVAIDFAQRIITAFTRDYSTTKPVMETKQQKLYEIAKANLGKHLTQNASVPIEVGCGEALSVNLTELGEPGIPWDGIAGTDAMQAYLLSNPSLYVEIPQSQASAGTIIISNTDGIVGHVEGHCGIVANYGIMSNNSSNGLWQEKWTLEEWINYYVKYGGLTARFFNPIG